MTPRKRLHRLSNYASNRSREVRGIIAEIKGHIIHEGRESRLIRSSDDQDDVEMHATEAVLTLKYADISKFTIVDALDAAAKLADQFATGQSKALFKTLDEVTTKLVTLLEREGRLLTTRCSKCLIRWSTNLAVTLRRRI